VSFPPPPRDPQDIEAALVAEVEQLEPWYRISCSRRGRTTVGLGARDPVTLARFVAAHLDATPPALRPELGAGENLKLACEDLKAFYTEAATARPGPDDAHALAQWLWAETALARAFVLLEPRLLASGDASLRRVGSDYLIPRVQAHRRREPPSPA
jgi:hypothetical protein